ncbi:hypothetical protein [Streptomyces sp. BR123]|uniref:hypothetical protein n=1 Tax=Streptomyces sp. BR123 TaxID=2749828 RepID=UPI00211B06C9|nr:hypothetical protein [Streptomyces sp. BR123]
MSDEAPDASEDPAVPEPSAAAGASGGPDVPERAPGDAHGDADRAAQASDGPDGPAPLGLVRTPTGNAAVDAHLDRLADVDHLTADGHAAVYEDVHRGLRDALTALDAPPVPGPYENRS